MRLRQRDLRPYVVKHRITVKEPDATTYETWSESYNPNPVWDAGIKIDLDKGIDSEESFESEAPNYQYWERWLGPASLGPVFPGESLSVIFANIQPAGGRVMAEQYGERLAYMLTLYAQRGANITESSGICVNVPPSMDPDYRVVSIQPWRDHIVAVLEKVR